MMPPVIIGSGLAGLSAALALDPLPVIVLTRKTPNKETSSGLAQGGIAAAVGAGDDPKGHAQDTLAAGAGLCDPATVKLVTEGAPGVIEQLSAWGVAFDHDEQGRLKLGLEGAHGRRRIVHAEGDGTGAAVMRALMARARATPSITLIEDVVVTDLLTDEGTLSGVRYRDENGNCHQITTSHAVLATGGAGALWQHTTNPLGSWGQGLALAARAGAILRDLEFVQFHPTAMNFGNDPLPLASEALRGEGAVLVNERGEKFMAPLPLADLAPRDEVARAIWAQMKQGHRVFLDARHLPSFAKRFPTITAYGVAAGIDPARQLIPVVPAAHYHMGGVAVDADGRTSIPGLWACGEVASTGLHGANRLASNSLLEAVVFGQRIAENISVRHSGESRNLSPSLHINTTVSLRLVHEMDSGFRRNDDILEETPDKRAAIRAIMSAHVGVLRDRAGLERAVAQLKSLAERSDMALAGLMIAAAALRREESRGAQARTDFSATSDAWHRHQTLTLDDVLPSQVQQSFVLRRAAHVGR
jgi:L-aspartate oxidase